MTTIIALIIAGLSTVIAFIAFRSSTKAAREQARATDKAIDAAAYERAKGMYESIIRHMEEDAERREEEAQRRAREEQRLRGEVSRLQTEVSNLHTEVGRLQRANDHLAAELAAFQGGP